MLAGEARAVLGLPPAPRPLDAGDVERAFRSEARCKHPDAGGDAASFAALVLARDQLLGEHVRRPPLTVRHSLHRRVVLAARARLPFTRPPRVH